MRDGPVVIFGAPRSGTTYLNAILNEQPGVFITHETRVFAWLHHTFQLTKDRPDLVLGHGDEFREYVGSALAGDIRDFYRSLRPRCFVWGDKNPHYVSSDNRGCLDTVATLYPEAKFIHIMRDGRDVVTSLVRKTKPDGTHWIDFDGAHRVWVSHVANAREFGARHANQYFELKYEDLVGDSTGLAHQVFEFLEWKMGERVEAFCRSQDQERTPLSQPTRSLDDPLSSEWSSTFDPDQQTRSMDLLRDRLTELGYLNAA